MMQLVWFELEFRSSFFRNILNRQKTFC